MTKETQRKKRIKKILATLHKLFPKPPKTALYYKKPWQLLVAVILSAQCTDKKVNEVTKILFKKYKSLLAIAHAKRSQFEKDIKSTGFYKTKAKNIQTMAQKVEDNFGGKIPKSMQELITLPGVARKTANVVLSNAFGIVEGIAVDTHVKRFTQKFDLSENKVPEKIEQDLMCITPKGEWSNLSNLLIFYGREICPARKHDCRNHPLTKIYPKAATVWPKAK